MQRKGQQGIGVISLLLTGGIILVIVAVALGIGTNVLTDVRDTYGTYDFPNNNNSNFVDNVSDDGILGLGNIAGNTGLIGTVIGLSVVLLILVTLLFRQFSRGV